MLPAIVFSIFSSAHLTTSCYMANVLSEAYVAGFDASLVCDRKRLCFYAHFCKTASTGISSLNFIHQSVTGKLSNEQILYS